MRFFNRRVFRIIPMKDLHLSGSLITGSLSGRKKSLKNALAMNLRQILKRRGLTVIELTKLLRTRGSDINNFAVRAWLRLSEQRPTLPSALNLVILSEVLGITIEELFDMAPQESASFFRKLREPEDHLEREIVRVISAIQKEYDRGKGDTEIVQQPLTTGNEYAEDSGSPENDAARLDRRAYFYLLTNDLVRFYPEAIARDTALETQLIQQWEKKGNGSVLDQACIYRLPNKVSDNSHVFNGIAEVVFFRCAAQFLIDNVLRNGITMGIAGGKTVASIMKLLPRTKKLRGCNFFPLLRPTAVFADTPLGGASVIADVLFRYGDLDVRMPDDVDELKNIEMRMNVADALLFSLGGSERSSIFNLLRRIRKTAAPEEQERLKNVLSGDILFHVYTRSGKTLEEAHAERSMVEEGEWALARELIPEMIVGGGAPQLTQTQIAYKKHIADTRLDLDFLKAHAKRTGRRTILVVAGIDKLDIVKVFIKRICGADMRFTLITEQSLARELAAYLA
jgi:transcriptional regulator with XRE-family HTH domain